MKINPKRLLTTLLIIAGVVFVYQVLKRRGILNLGVASSNGGSGNGAVAGDPTGDLLYKAGDYHGCTCGTVEMQAPVGTSCSDFCKQQGAYDVVTGAAISRPQPLVIVR